MINHIGAKIVKDNKMKVVHDNDLEKLLRSLGVYDEVANMQFKCIFCENEITLDNIDSIVPYNRSIQFTCDSSECHSKLIGWEK